MMSVGRVRNVIAPLFAICVAVEASAQSATIRGRVTNVQGAPVPGAIVQITSLNLRTTTTMTGTYSLPVPEGRATGQQVAVMARFIGYRPQTRPVTLTEGTQELDFRLEADPFRLEEVVVTGVAEATSARKLTFSVAKISEDQVQQVPATSPITALAGKVSGVRVTPGRGTPGAAPAIRLRGSTNLGVGGSSPLIIVDGTITKNNIADLDANDIESIEVLKGAAAASFYGSDAANGVVNITTRRGRNVAENRVSFTSRNEMGFADIPRMIDLNRSHYFQLNTDGTIRTNASGTRLVETDRYADNPYPSTGPDRWRNQLEEWLTNGQFYTTNLQMGVRRGTTNLNTSFTYDRNQGTLPLTQGQYRRNFRMNVDQGIGTKADASASITYGLINSDFDPTLSANANNSGEINTFFALLQAPPDVDLRYPDPAHARSRGLDSLYYPRIPPAKTPNARGNPLYQLANEDYNLRRERIIGSVSARYRPWEWLRFEASYGTDRLNRQEQNYRFRGYLNNSASATQGSLTRASLNNVAQNSQVSATATRLWFNQLLSTTRAAYLFETTDDNNYTASGSRLVVSATPDLAAVDPLTATVNSGLAKSRTINYMVSQALDFRDRYLLDVLYRRDGSSLFGPKSRWHDFYRVSGKYRITEDFPIPGFQELGIRAARGTAGLRPDFSDQYETYSLLNGQIAKAQLGNESLEPAVQTENEFGINATFLDRFDVEVVHAERKTVGAFLNVPLSLGLSGGFVSQVQNAADVGARTTELSIQARVLDRPNMSYTIGLTGDHTTQKILRMNRAPFRVGAGGQGQEVFFYKAGEPLGIIYGARWVRSFAELQENPAFANANPNDYVINPLGYLVTRASRGTGTERPIAYVNAAGETVHKIGDVNPDFSFGFVNNFRWRGLGLYVLFDGQRGGDIYNFTKQWMFQDFRHGDQDQAGKPDSEKIALDFYSSGLYNALNASDYFVEDGSFVKLRELSVSYTFGQGTLARMGVSRYATGLKVALIGRNLYTWTDYSGFDPDVTAGSDFNFRIDGFRYPNLRTVTGQVEITF